MSDVLHYVWLIPVLPLLAAAFTTLFGPRFLKGQSHWPCVLALVVVCVLSFRTLQAVSSAVHHAHDTNAHEVQEVKTFYQWFAVGAGTGKDGQPLTVDVGFTLRVDPLTAIMLVIITFIGSLIAIYSIGYMHDDPGYPRFFAAMSLFIFSMTLLVLADNFLLLYAGWEGVGLCSYLLIGFWFNKPSAAAAARKAFLVTRIGDVGLLIGILVLWYTTGSLQYDAVFDGFRDRSTTLVCLLIFCGAAGKSAQFPLHVWLPDAMEGPTPVSALIHAATMVTAGVYLVARCTPLFVASATAQLVVAILGSVTMLLAALIALTQTDLKRVLAYSTLSQLGYMFLALGSGVGGDRSLATFAVTAAIFHLFTHAFFKALLFLGAGSVMHAMGGVIDMRRFGGLRKLMPLTHMTFLIGCLALGGFPLLSGFWSKDEILTATFGAAKYGKFGWVYWILFTSALFTAGLTGFYTFRAYFLTFWGPERIPEEAGHHAHESPYVMTLPLMVLAAFALVIGAAVGPTHLFVHFLEMTPGFPAATPPRINWGVMLGSSFAALTGIGLAWGTYMQPRKEIATTAAEQPLLYQLSLNKFYIDELYNALIVAPLTKLADAIGKFDWKFIHNGAVQFVAAFPGMLGGLFRPIQNGLVQFYALAMMLGLVVFLIALARSL